MTSLGGNEMNPIKMTTEVGLVFIRVMPELSIQFEVHVKLVN